MKSTIITKLLSGIILISLVGFIKTPLKKDSIGSKECLKVNGLAVAEGNKAIDSVEVTLLEKNEEMEWIAVTNVPYHDHAFSFTLEINKYYTIEISKPGFVKRSVVISTFMPSDISVKPIFEYWFQVELFKEKKDVDDYYLDFPVALIGYNRTAGVFDNNHSYTHHIKTKIKAESDRLSIERMINGKY